MVAGQRHDFPLSSLTDRQLLETDRTVVAGGEYLRDQRGQIQKPVSIIYHPGILDDVELMVIILRNDKRTRNGGTQAQDLSTDLAALLFSGMACQQVWVERIVVFPEQEQDFHPLTDGIGIGILVDPVVQERNELLRETVSSRLDRVLRVGKRSHLRQRRPELLRDRLLADDGHLVERSPVPEDPLACREALKKVFGLLSHFPFQDKKKITHHHPAG